MFFFYALGGDLSSEDFTADFTKRMPLSPKLSVRVFSVCLSLTEEDGGRAVQSTAC